MLTACLTSLIHMGRPPPASLQHHQLLLLPLTSGVCCIPVLQHHQLRVPGPLWQPLGPQPLCGGEQRQHLALAAIARPTQGTRWGCKIGDCRSSCGCGDTSVQLLRTACLSLCRPDAAGPPAVHCVLASCQGVRGNMSARLALSADIQRPGVLHPAVMTGSSAAECTAALWSTSTMKRLCDQAPHQAAPRAATTKNSHCLIASETMAIDWQQRPATVLLAAGQPPALVGRCVDGRCCT